MTREDWDHLEQSLKRLEVEQVEQRLAVSPVLFAGEARPPSPRTGWIARAREKNRRARFPSRPNRCPGRFPRGRPTRIRRFCE